MDKILKELMGELKNFKKEFLSSTYELFDLLTSNNVPFKKEV